MFNSKNSLTNPYDSFSKPGTCGPGDRLGRLSLAGLSAPAVVTVQHGPLYHLVR